MTEPLFTRDGIEYTGQVFRVEKSLGFYETPVCGRCGGPGGREEWRHTGWTCFDCQGSGKAPQRFVKLYTAEKLSKLNAAAEKREAARQTVLAAKAAVAKAEADARLEAFLGVHGALLARVEELLASNPTAMDIASRARQRAVLTEPQAEFLGKMVAAEEARLVKVATTNYLGEVGARLDLPVTVVRVSSFERAPYMSGYARFTGYMETVWIVIMEDASGNQIVSKSPNFKEEVGEKFTLRATVKEHSVYKDVKQTVVNRAKRV